jgi:hypothetical protein
MLRIAPFSRPCKSPGGRTVLLRHATPARNLPSIRKGLLCARSQGRLPAVWLHSPSATWWAVTHTVLRHGGRVEDVVVLEVAVPRAWLRRHRRRLWYSAHDIPAWRIARVIRFAEVAAAPCR